MPRGRIESQTPIGDDNEDILKKDGDFFPIPRFAGVLKVINGGFDPQLPNGRRIPFLSAFKVKLGEEHDFIKISSVLPTGLLVH